MRLIVEQATGVIHGAVADLPPEQAPEQLAAQQRAMLQQIGRLTPEQIERSAAKKVPKLQERQRAARSPKGEPPLPGDLVYVSVEGNPATYPWPHPNGPTACLYQFADSTIVANPAIPVAPRLLAESVIVNRLYALGATYVEAFQTARVADKVLHEYWISRQEVDANGAELRAAITAAGANPDEILAPLPPPEPGDPPPPSPPPGTLSIR